MFHCGVDFREYNIVLISKPIADVDAFCSQVKTFFGKNKLPFRLLCRYNIEPAMKTIVDQLSLRQTEDFPAMAIASDEYRPPAITAELDLVKVQHADQVAGFQQVAAEAYGLDLNIVKLILTETFFNSAKVDAFIGYVNNTPASTALLFKEADIAGIYWVATATQFRQMGLAEALTAATIEAARQEHYATVILQASKMGYPVYKRMGFITIPYQQFDSP